MLAYGRSKRTLRFSYQEEFDLDSFDQVQSPIDLIVPGQITSLPVRGSTGENIEGTSYPSQPSTPSRHSNNAPSEASCPSNNSAPAAITSIPIHCGDSAREQTGATSNGFGAHCVGGGVNDMAAKRTSGSGIRDPSNRSDGLAPSRKRFCLDIDFGSDSESSCDGDNGKAHPNRRYLDGDLVASSSSTLETRSTGRDRRRSDSVNRSVSVSNNYRQIAQGDESHGLSTGLCQRRGPGSGAANDQGRHETPPHKTDQRQGESAADCRESYGWEDERPWNRAGPSGWGRRGIGGVGRLHQGVQHLDDDQGGASSRASLVAPDYTEAAKTGWNPKPPSKYTARPASAVRNPYQAAVPVIPNEVHLQRAGYASPALRNGDDLSRTAGRRSASSGGDGESGSQSVYVGSGSTVRQMPSLITVQDVYPDELSRIWPFQNFNSIQSVLHQTVAKTDRNVVVSAPTGCGKTVVLEMAIARLLHESGMSLGNRKVIYISPIKALCQQTLDDWTAKFSAYGIRLAELTSDSASGPSKGSVSLRDLASADIILTTPEKWDSVTRRWKEHAFLVGTVALVLVDEVHTIGEERGATLEVILTRMKMVSKSSEVISMGLPASRMRFIALSATLPNAKDFGSFLGAEVFRFGDEYRPVSLQTHVVGYPSGSNPFLFDRGLNKHVPGIVERYSNGKPSLVFCGSKKDTETLAASLVQGTNYARRTGSQVVMQYLSTAASKADDPQLARLIVKGVAIHNSGLSPSDRGLVERAFLSGSITVLVATTTLAMGVNLPARLVVIKGTNQYRGAKGYQELPKSAILQMMGRAGRPGFDSSGVAVVMTSKSNKDALERLSAGEEAVESSLQARLLEALNSEVCQGETIHDIGEAIEWLRSTFYFIRCQKNPCFYGLPSGLKDGGLHGHMQTTCLNGLKQLREAGVIAMCEDEFSVKATPHGVLFSRFMVRFDSMKAVMGVSEEDGIMDVLRVCAGCDELNVPVRRAEKRLLNELNKQVRYPPPKKEIIRTPADKALALLQAGLGGLPLEDWTLRGEQTSMLDTAARLLGCCAESLAVARRGGGLGCAVSLRLMRSVRLKMWMDTKLGQLRQLPGVGDTMCVRLGGSQIITLLDLARVSSAKVDTIAGRKHPFGHGVRHAALQLLSRALTASVSRQELGGGKVELQVRVELAFQSTDSFADRYIEAPDDAYAPPPTGWRRHDTNFHLLVYQDPPTMGQVAKAGYQESSGVTPSGGKPSPSVAAIVPGIGTTDLKESSSSSSPLLLYRKVTGEGMHSTTLSPETTTDDRTLHLWLICSGVNGIDVVDVRMKPSSLGQHFTSVEELRGIWSQNGRVSSNQNTPDDEEGDEETPDGDCSVSASDRRGWSDWEHNDQAPAKRIFTRDARGRRGFGVKEKRGGVSDAGGAGRRRGTRTGRTNTGVGANGGMQLDLASSFKAGAQRALSDSARKSSTGACGVAQSRDAHPGVTAKERASHGLSRGDLGAIGVSDAGDNLEVHTGSGGSSKSQGRVSDNGGASTVPQQQLTNHSRTWNPKSRTSGAIFPEGRRCSASGQDISTYNANGKTMRTVLRQKGSEMCLSSRVGINRLGKSPGTPSTAGRWIATAASTPSGGHRSTSTNTDTAHPGGGTQSEFLHFPGGGDDGGGVATVDPFSSFRGPLCGSPEEARRYRPGKRQLVQPVDFSSFSFEESSPPQATVMPASVHIGVMSGGASLEQPERHQTSSCNDPNPMANTTSYVASSVITRSWNGKAGLERSRYEYDKRGYMGHAGRAATTNTPRSDLMPGLTRPTREGGRKAIKAGAEIGVAEKEEGAIARSPPAGPTELGIGVGMVDDGGMGYDSKEEVKTSGVSNGGEKGILAQSVDPFHSLTPAEPALRGIPSSQHLAAAFQRNNSREGTPLLRPRYDDEMVKDRARVRDSLTAIRNPHRPNGSLGSVPTIVSNVPRGGQGETRQYLRHGFTARCGGRSVVSVTPPGVANALSRGFREDISERPARRAAASSWSGSKMPGEEKARGTTWHSEPIDNTRKHEDSPGMWLDPPEATSDENKKNDTTQSGHTAKPGTPCSEEEPRDRSVARDNPDLRVGGLCKSSNDKEGGDDRGLSGEVESGGSNSQKDVAKKLDFHSVFD